MLLSSFLLGKLVFKFHSDATFRAMLSVENSREKRKRFGWSKFVVAREPRNHRRSLQQVPRVENSNGQVKKDLFECLVSRLFPSS